MAFLYSPSTRGFYLSETSHPSDVVHVSDAEHAALMTGQAAGQRIVPGAGGHPVLEWPEVPAPTLSDARHERDRRIAGGTTVTVTGVGTIPLQGRDIDRANMQGIATVAQVKIAAGDTSPIRFRDAENVIHDLTPAQVIEMYLGGAAFIEACHDVVWGWADGAGVPADFTDPAYWP